MRVRIFRGVRERSARARRGCRSRQRRAKLARTKIRVQAHENRSHASTDGGARLFDVQANAFYCEREKSLKQRLDALEADLRSDGSDAALLKRSKKVLVKEFYPELSELREFVVLNYTAVVKAVKKFNKNCNRKENAVSILSASPIFYSLGLAKLVTRTEMLAVHAAPPTSSKVLEDSICPVCEDVLSNPVVLPHCKHKFCFKCIINAAPSASAPLITTNSVTVLSDLTDSPLMKTPANRVAMFPGRCPVCKSLDANHGTRDMFEPDSTFDEFIKSHFSDIDLETNVDDVKASSPESTKEEASSSVVSTKAPAMRKVLLIAVAGCRVDAMLIANTPTLKSFVRGKKNSCFSLDMQASAMRCSTSASSPMLPVLTGQSVSVLKAIDEDDEATLTSLFERLKEVRSWVKGAFAVGQAEDLHKILQKEAKALLGKSQNTDTEAAEAVTRALESTVAPDVIFLHMGEIQKAGFKHGFGPHVDKYMSAIETADSRLSVVLEALQRRQAANPSEDWLVILTSPSGGTCRSDMPAGMQGDFDAHDWNDGGGRQLRSNGVSGLLELPQHSAGWVMIESGPRLNMVGELLPSPRDTDIAPTLLEHFGVATRRDWTMDGEDMLSFRRRENSSKDPSMPSTRLKNTKKGFEHTRISTNNGSSKPFSAHLPGLFEPTGCAVIGHRGLQANRSSGAGIRENTVASFTAAAEGGAEWCEFDVQVTSDGVPVAWHDDVVIIRRGQGPLESFSVREIAWADLRELSRAAKRTAQRPADALGVENAKRIFSTDEDDDQDEEHDAQDDVTFYRVFGSDPEPQPWVMEIEDEIPTLAQILGNSPASLGFNVELKYDEENSCNTRRLVAELRSILAVCSSYRERRIVFSSFDPDAALLMRAIQGSYPVMILTDADADHVDPRRRSVAAAMQVALEGGLCGVVSDVQAIMRSPADALGVRHSGLILATYGEGNDDDGAAGTQVELGVFGIITDAVPTVVKKFSSSKTLAPPLSFRAAPASEMEAMVEDAVEELSKVEVGTKSELDNVLKSNWYKLSDDARKTLIDLDDDAVDTPSTPMHRRRGSRAGSEVSDHMSDSEQFGSPDSYQSLQSHNTRNNSRWTGYPQFARGVSKERRPQQSLAAVQPKAAIN